MNHRLESKLIQSQATGSKHAAELESLQTEIANLRAENHKLRSSLQQSNNEQHHVSRKLQRQDFSVQVLRSMIKDVQGSLQIIGDKVTLAIQTSEDGDRQV